MAIPPSLLTFLAGMALMLTSYWLGTHLRLMPVEASANAPIVDNLFQVLFIIGAILFLGIVGLLGYSLIRFRRQPGDQSDGSAVEDNLPLEILWTAIPAIVVLFVGIYSYDIYEQMGGMGALNDHALMQHGAMQHEVMQVADADPDPRPRLWGGITTPSGEADALPVEVTALQFAFLFHYPEGDITSGELHVPRDRPVQLRMEARDVIHAFWVPQFRLKQDVIPGQPTVLSFTATRSGSYPIVCAELCGPYHGGMRSTVVVHDPDDFDAWLAKNRPAPTATA
ncbi:MAG: cytochrome c oxidase subunit II [Prochlorococcaceae cyanobacterium]